MGRAVHLYLPGISHSPIADPDDIRGQEAGIWARRDLMPGVNMNDEAQLVLLMQLKPHVGQIEFPIERSADPAQYYYANDQFFVLNAEWGTLWAANYIKTRHPAALQEIFPHSFEEAFSRFPKVGVGNSFWMRRKGRAAA